MTLPFTKPFVPHPTEEEPHEFAILTDQEIEDIRRKLLDAQGDWEKAGVTARMLRNVVYTKRMAGKPLSATSDSAVEKAKKSTAGKEMLPLVNMNDFLEG